MFMARSIKMRNFSIEPDIQYLYHLTNVFELVTSEKIFKVSANEKLELLITAMSIAG